MTTEVVETTIPGLQVDHVYAGLVVLAEARPIVPPWPRCFPAESSVAHEDLREMVRRRSKNLQGQTQAFDSIFITA